MWFTIPASIGLALVKRQVIPASSDLVPVERQVIPASIGLVPVEQQVSGYIHSIYRLGRPFCFHRLGGESRTGGAFMNATKVATSCDHIRGNPDGNQGSHSARQQIPFH